MSREDALRDFAARLALMRQEASELGLYKTMHAFYRPTTKTTDGAPAGPLYVVGFEIHEQHQRDVQEVR
ncbi:MAG: hypothetical protein ACPGVG_16015 [Mycobacterium sp.]